MALIPGAVTITSVTQVVGQATGVITTGLIDSPDYRIELEALASAVAALDAQVALINTNLIAMNVNVTAILTYLTTVQTAAGAFRTSDSAAVGNQALVNAAMASNIPPITIG
jgi:hypothetical protein